MNDHESETAGIGTELATESESETSSERARSRRRRSRSLAAEISVNMEELRELIQLIRDNDFTEFELEREGFRVRFRRGDAVRVRAVRDRSESAAQAVTSRGVSQASDADRSRSGAGSSGGQGRDGGF